tara:strand:- start:548 stop:703 length:156 start_codon:yes stop_codon:yes gene_type:complete
MKNNLLTIILISILFFYGFLNAQTSSVTPTTTKESIALGGLGIDGNNTIYF